MNDIINSFFSLDVIQKQHEILDIMKTNDDSSQYALSLTNVQALEIVETKNHSLKSYGRMEFGGSIVNKLIKAFCSSPYINQKDYALVINELVETFYYLKNETMDSIGDEELIELMSSYFNNSCRGSMELLQGRELESLARSMRYDFCDDDYGESEIEYDDFD